MSKTAGSGRVLFKAYLSLENGNGLKKMVFTLHRYIFRELIKVFVLAAVALTLILSLGSILRPVQEYGAGPRQVIHLMGYFLPITLTFVLPMAALFAASLVYGRFAYDNELDACRASGINLLTLVYPGLALAIMVATANLILSFYVMPVFVHRAEKSLKADAQQILFCNIQQKGFYKSPDNRYLIYADLADPKNNILAGIVVADVKNSEIKKIITAESAKVHFNPHERYNELQIMAHNTYQLGSENEGWFFFEWLPLTKEFPSLLGDNIKFKKIDEIKKIRDVDPMLFEPIEKLARQTYVQFTTELLAQDIAEKITGKTDNSYKLYNNEIFVDFTAGQCRILDYGKAEISEKVVVSESDAAGRKLLRTLRCARALLFVEGDELSPTLTMELQSPTWRRPDGTEGIAQRYIIRGLVLPVAVTDKLENTDVLKAVSPASVASALKKGPGKILTDLQKGLQKEIWRIMAEIDAEINSRLVFGIGCVSVIMIGIGLGIILKGGHLLSAFGVSSVPAAMLVVCIMMGKNIATNPSAKAGSGVILMWAGLVLLTALAAGIYHKLLKN